MTWTDTSDAPGTFGSGDFAFGEWATPFTDTAVDLLEVSLAPNGQGGRDLVARVRTLEPDAIYRLVFPSIAAMRLLDESGLLELWQRTAALGGCPGRTTFRVRNHAWARESVLSFLSSDGWSFVVATENECLEVVCPTAPTITEA